MRKSKGKHTYVYKQNASLKKEAYKHLKAIDIGLYKEIKKNRSPFWAPSPRNLLIFYIIAVVAGILAHIHELGIMPVDVDVYINLNLVTKLNDYMIEICIGISAVLIGFAFFVAQSFLDKEDPDRGRVLLYTSEFYFLLSSSIAILIMYIFGKPNIIADLLIVSLGIFTVISLYRTVLVLLYVNEMEKARLELFKSIIQKFILHELCRRISYQELFKASDILQKKYKVVSISPFSTVRNGFRIKSMHSGTVTDIKLGKYERLLLKAEKKEKGSSENEEIILNLQLMPFDHINENNTLIEMSKDQFSTLLSKKNIGKQVRSIFLVKKADYEETTEIEISKLKQRCFLLIEQERDDDLEKALTTFKEISTLFINIFYKAGWNFKKEQAEKQRVAFPGERFKLIDWIIDSYTLIFYKALNSNNLQIIRYASSLPISLSVLAIRRNDHLIFQYFIRYPVLMYKEGYKKKLKNKEAFEFIIDKSWRYLKELSAFYLERLYKEGEIEEQEFIDYSFYIFKAFQDLLKESYEKTDIKSFKIYLTKYISLYEYLDYHTRFIRAGQSTFDKVNSLRNETLFGIGSWIFSQNIDKKDDSKIYLVEVLNIWKMDITELTELFINIHKDIRKWGWHDWEIETKEEDEVYSLNMPSELEKFYVVICLRLLRSKPSIDGFYLTSSFELASMTDTLIQIIKSIKKDSKEWEVLSENEILKCGDLIRLLERAKKQQDEKEAEFIREIPITGNKVTRFKEGVLKLMQSLQGIKRLMKHYNSVIFEDKCSDLSDVIGYNRFFEKEWFIDDEKLNAAWDGFDKYIGESMINGENQNILQKIQEKAQEIPEESFEEHLNKIENLDKVIIIAVNHEPLEFFERKYDSDTYIVNWYTNFSDKWLSEFPEGLEGILIYKHNKVPFYEYFNNLSFKGVLIIDLNNLKLSQYPLALGSDEPYITIDVQAFESGSSEEDEIIKNAPEWLKKIGDEEAQRHYVEQRVLVKVLEQFEIITEKNAVAKILIE